MMQRLGLERSYGTPRALASAEPVEWTEDVDVFPVRAGVYLGPDAVWLWTPVEGHLRAASPAGAVLDADVGCPVAVTRVAPAAVDHPFASMTNDLLLVPGTYEFRVTPGVWGYTHTGTYLATLPD